MIVVFKTVSVRVSSTEEIEEEEEEEEEEFFFFGRRARISGSVSLSSSDS
jgi:hypothetical protein